MASEVLYNEDKDALFSNAADLILEKLRSSSVERPLVGLCGGRSIVGLLKALAEKKEALPQERWRTIEFFMVDERLVDLSSDDSNYKLVYDLFLKDAVASGLLSEAQLHPFILQEELPDSGIAAYQQEFESYGGSFDLVFLGVGEDGHVAALFPNHPSIADEGDFFVRFDDSPKPPNGRMSASRSLIERARFAMALFVGEGKRQALLNYRDPSHDVQSCPVKMIDKVSDSYAITDLSD